MTNLPKELEEIRDNKADNYDYRIKYPIHISANTPPQYPGITHIGEHFKNGFNTCHQEMLKTYVPREKVEKLVEALKFYADSDNYKIECDEGGYGSSFVCEGDLYNHPGTKASEALKEFGSKE